MKKYLFILIACLSCFKVQAQNPEYVLIANPNGTAGAFIIYLEWPANAANTNVRAISGKTTMLYDENAGTPTIIAPGTIWAKTSSATAAAINTAVGAATNPNGYGYMEFTTTSTINFGNVSAGSIDTILKFQFPNTTGVGDIQLLTGISGVGGIDTLHNLLTNLNLQASLEFRTTSTASYVNQLLNQRTGGGASLVVPVDLISFNATALNETAIVTWQTASEVNNSHFVLERSKDGIVWEAIQAITGAGNSNTILSYQHTDLNPFKGSSYYQLKQVDYNGEYAYSDVKVVDFDNELNVTITPNPTRGQLFINLKRSSGIKSVQLSNTKGVILYYEQIQQDQTSFIIDVSQYSPGIYFLQIIGNHGNVETRKIIKE